MYVTLYAADNPQIVFDTINYDFLDGNQINVTCEVMTDVPEPVAEDLLSIIEYVQKFYPESEPTNMDSEGGI